MSSAPRIKGEPCPYESCGSRRYYTGDDGYTYCDRGHQQRERGTVIAEDTGEFVPVGRSVRRKDSDAESSRTRGTSAGFTGAEALEHYLLCVQLVLRKQLRWLIDAQKLPEELEVLVKDLWALRLQKLQFRISYDSDTETDAPTTQVFSSQSERDSQSTRRSRQRRMKPKEGTPNLLELLSLCYTGVLLLRSPITAADILKWVNNGELLYYRAAREVPFGLRERLPPQYQRLLEPADLIKPEPLHEAVLETLSFLNKDFGMAVPSINVPLVVYRWMKDMLLPLEVFAGTQRLTSLLELEIKFDLSKISSRALLRYPEVQLMALIVVATKLLFPTGTKPFKTRAATDLSAVVFDWDSWLKLQEERKKEVDRKDNLTYAEAFEFDEDDCLNSSEDKLDAYLDWCEENIASEDIREHGRAGRDAVFRRALFEMFPLPGKRNSSATEIPAPPSTPPIGGLSTEARLTDEDAPRTMAEVGESYRRFRKLEDLSDTSKVLYEEAAKLACVSLEGMVQAVFLVERRLQKVEERLRRSEAT
ncbi:uncharacterized protein LTR77_000713 [Saxophila tyrrhenica]|uniref:RRN7-type domain-containing protein n=1 Tax=Saxophila tyrrhenica TaxID=1690608 RepID=A0AAV9PNS7_9PEZI|nr:hypothetical protein LTR77_000713 [Saxophila tyrrhenica]